MILIIGQGIAVRNRFTFKTTADPGSVGADALRFKESVVTQSRVVYTTILVLAVLVCCVMPQMQAQVYDCDTAYAVERWSQPERLPFWVNTWDDANMYPSWGPDGKTIFFLGKLGRICTTTLSDTGWTQCEIFPATKNYSYCRGSCMAPDNKTFYFCGSVGGAWAVFITKWNDDSLKWLPPEPMLMWRDTSLWNQYEKKYALIPVGAESIHLSRDGKQFYFDGGGKVSCSENIDFLLESILVSNWDEENQRWGEQCDLGPNVNYDIFCPERDTRDIRPSSFQTISPSLTADGRKLYFVKKFDRFYNFEILVAIRDSSGGWARARRLNINSYADSTKSRIWDGSSGYDEQPAISPDGKTLVFASRRNTMLYNWWEDLYISHLIVDENGDSVLTSVENASEFEPEVLSIEIFPNPSSRTVSIAIRKQPFEHIRIELFNIHGGYIRTIDAGDSSERSMRLTWDGLSDLGEKVPPGVYILRAATAGKYLIRRVLLL